MTGQLPIIVVSGFSERRAALLENLIHNGVAADRITFIDAPIGAAWRNLDISRPPDPFWRDERNPKLITHGEQCCFHGHMMAWHKVVELNQPCIILEDDARLQGALPEEWTTSQENGVYYLGYKRLDDWPASDEDFEWRQAPFVWWTVGYMLAPFAADILYDSALVSPALPADEFIPWHCSLGLSENRLELIRPNGQANALSAYCAQHPPVVPASPESATDNHDYAFDLQVLLFGTDGERLREPMAALSKAGFNVAALGVGEPGWDTNREGGRPKFEWLMAWLANQTETALAHTIILAMDGYDTALHNASPQDVLKCYGSLRWPCIVSGERSYWPARGLENEFGTGRYYDDDAQGGTSQPYNYPCSGVFMAPAAVLRDQLKEVLDEYRDEQDDQGLMHRMVLARPKLWRVDDGAALVQNLKRAENDVGAGGVNSVTGTRPLIYHANSDAMMPAHVDLPGRLAPFEILYGYHQPVMEIADNMFLVPLLSLEEARVLGERIGAVVDGWEALPADDVPGDELRGALLAPLRDLVRRYAFPLLNSRLAPARIGKVRDIFAIRHSPDGQRRLRLHNDISYMSGSVKLFEADRGGELFFPRQNWSDRLLEPGCSVWWPSAITYPHTTTQVREGVRLAVTIWTDR